MRNKPITMVKVTHGYNLFVNNTPVVKHGKGITFHREKGGLPPSKDDSSIPEGKRPHLFRKKDDAFFIAHQIGKYLFKGGDFVNSYVEPVGWTF